MASEIDIANLALAHLGDTANVSSFDPPEGSAQAEKCARFYPIARDALLELGDWNFATRRATLALLGEDDWSMWAYTYALPIDCLKVKAVLDPEATDDLTLTIPPDQISTSLYAPQTFVVEVDPLTDVPILLTNQASAVLRYTARVTDTSRFSPLFVNTLSYYLASYLAGPVIKGDTGMAVAQKMLGIAMGMLGKAQMSDANQRRTSVTPTAPWIAGR